MAGENPTFRNLLQSSTVAILADDKNKLSNFDGSTVGMFLEEFRDLLSSADLNGDPTAIRFSNLIPTQTETILANPNMVLLAVALANFELYADRLGVSRWK